jgi:hypothetical protein
MLQSVLEAKAAYRLVMDAAAARFLPTIEENIALAMKEGRPDLHIPTTLLSDLDVRAIIHVIQRKNYKVTGNTDIELIVSGWADL